MKPLVLSLFAVLLAESGCALVMLNAAPHQPVGFWLWFGGIAIVSPIAGYYLYRRLIAAKA